MRYVLIKPKARVLNDLWGHNSFCYNVRLTRSVVTYDVASAKTGIEDDNKEPNLADVVVATTRQRQDLQAARTKDITKDHNIPSMIGFRNVSFMLHTNVTCRSSTGYKTCSRQDKSYKVLLGLKWHS
jgi:hypothetical protein